MARQGLPHRVPRRAESHGAIRGVLRRQARVRALPAGPRGGAQHAGRHRPHAALPGRVRACVFCVPIIQEIFWRPSFSAQFIQGEPQQRSAGTLRRHFRAHKKYWVGGGWTCCGKPRRGSRSISRRYHGHDAVCLLLLESGADPDVAASEPPHPRKPQDVARTPELAALLSTWDRGDTKFRMVELRKRREAALMQRCRTAAERSALAKAQLRGELVALAEKGDVVGLTAELERLAREAEELDERPRAGAQAARDDRGHTLLGIAAWKGHTALAEKLCTHWLQYKVRTN